MWQGLGGSLMANPAKLVAAGWRLALGTREGLSAMKRAPRTDDGSLSRRRAWRPTADVASSISVAAAWIEP
jgi:hypothetical protein